MVLVLNEIVIPFQDLRHVSVECDDCHTLIIIDLEGGLFDVTNCAGCNRTFDASVKDALRTLSRLYVHMKTARHKFAFRVPAPK